MYKKYRFLSLGVALVIMMALLASCGGTGGSASSAAPAGNFSSSAVPAADTAPDTATNEVRVAIVNNSTYSASGWTLSHYYGYQYLVESNPDLDALWVDNVPDTGPDVEQMLERLVSEGYNMLVTTSFGYQDAAVNIAKKYPDVHVLHIQGYAEPSENFSLFDIREYETTFLSGYIAGKMTKTNNVGYCGPIPVNTVVRALNGFAAGVKYANPEAKVNLLWTNLWYDTAKEREATQALIDSGSNVMGMFQATPAVLQCCEENDVPGIGFHTDQSEFAPNVTLTSYCWNWGPYYVQKVKEAQEGQWKSENAFFGIAEGYGELAPVNTELVPEDVIAEVEKLREQIKNGELSVFAGPINDNAGNELVPAGEMMDMEKIKAGDWLLDNIVGNLQ